MTYICPVHKQDNNNYILFGLDCWYWYNRFPDRQAYSVSIRKAHI